MPSVLAFSLAMSPPNSWGRFHPVVSGMFTVVAPARMTSLRTRYRKSGSDRPASSGLNSMSWHPMPLRCRTAFTAFSITSSFVIRSL